MCERRRILEQNITEVRNRIHLGEQTLIKVYSIFLTPIGQEKVFILLVRCQLHAKAVLGEGKGYWTVVLISLYVGSTFLLVAIHMPARKCYFSSGVTYSFVLCITCKFKTS